MAQAAAKIELFGPASDEDLADEALRLAEAARVAEALLFAASEPLDEAEIARRLPEAVTVHAVLEQLRADYAQRGVNLARAGRKWFFRTAPDLSYVLAREEVEQKKLSRAAMETLAIIAYHQPTTRAEIEELRGVAISKGTIDVLLETGWVRLRGRRKAPGRPITYGTTDQFLMHFGLEQIGDLPGLDELKRDGLFDGRLPKDFRIPAPSDDPTLREDEEPLEESLQPLEMEFGLEEEEAEPAEESPLED
ncbi:SMC-Scp complex subunit ScpB [Methylocystis bryophila]|uniref:SMC-Scp complex subunit ScpB n=1 Tax=Methylocystis bryophila TaxID=655015 RepID=A0A1W6MTC0_9HYPH|nr:SMC-Scp complex subunit ScpB [Methylocystis bryophila]ARN80844.1 SMC-Scp complex subunit ScpB [Methylocystis bryophila]BDV40929.1 hypothetical protein DSM21852_41820 [Methylocystis bryophila]